MPKRTRSGIQERRHRLGRESYAGERIVAFTACVDDRRPLFREAEVVQVFRHALIHASRKHSAAVVLYCFMPDHLHLVLQGDSPNADVWQAMVAFKQQTGFWLSQNLPQFRWQKDFFDRVIRRDEDLGAVLRYIVLNPVRHRLVLEWSEYPFTGSEALSLAELFSAA